MGVQGTVAGSPRGSVLELVGGSAHCSLRVQVPPPPAWPCCHASTSVPASGSGSARAHQQPHPASSSSSTLSQSPPPLPSCSVTPSPPEAQGSDPEILLTPRTPTVKLQDSGTALDGLDICVPGCLPCYKHTWPWGCGCSRRVLGHWEGQGWGIGVSTPDTQGCTATPVLACVCVCSLNTSVCTQGCTQACLRTLCTSPLPCPLHPNVNHEKALTPCASPSFRVSLLWDAPPALSPPCPSWPHPATAPQQPASPPAQTHSCTPGQAAASTRPRQLSSAPHHRHTGEVVLGTCT